MACPYAARAQLLQVAADVADAMAYLHLPPAAVTHRALNPCTPNMFNES